MRYKQALKLDNGDFKRLYGISQVTFEKMIKAVIEAKLGKQGCHSKLSIPDQILLTLQYWREYRTFFHIAQDWGIHESTAWRIVRRIVDAKRLLSVNILIEVDEFKLPSKRQLQKSDTQIVDALRAASLRVVIVVDISEVEIERPKKKRVCNLSLRGKCKTHSRHRKPIIVGNKAVIPSTGV